MSDVAFCIRNICAVHASARLRGMLDMGWPVDCNADITQTFVCS